MTEALTPERPHSEQIDVFGVSHPGRVRTENQDHFLVGSIHKTMNVLQSSLPEESLGELRSPSRGFVFLVADGVERTWPMASVAPLMLMVPIALQRMACPAGGAQGCG
mgnify:CR=1 FL=1